MIKKEMAPFYVSKKAHRLQNLQSQSLCLRHPLWSVLFFHSTIYEAESWLNDPRNQPLLITLTDAQLRNLDEVLIPVTREEVEVECQLIHEVHQEEEVPDLSLYERMVLVLLDQELFSEPTDERVSPRAFVHFTVMLNVRLEFVDVICEQWKDCPSFDRLLVVELEKEMCIQALQTMFEERPGQETLLDFFFFYDMKKMALIAAGAEKIGPTLFERRDISFLLEKRSFIEFQPDRWSAIDQKIHQPRERIVLQSNTNAYTCIRCHKRNIYVDSIQTRKSDEGATIFCRCLSCDKRFRAHN